MYDGLGFSDLEVGVLNTLAGAMGWLGIWAYDTFFFNDAWPWLFIWTTLVNAVFSFLQLLLCYGLTGPIPKIAFATGDSAISTAVTYVCFMPMCIMFLAMIPPGSESTLYALITTWQNVAGEVATDIGT